jgi:hypothetical protein
MAAKRKPSQSVTLHSFFSGFGSGKKAEFRSKPAAYTGQLERVFLSQEVIVIDSDSDSDGDAPIPTLKRRKGSSASDIEIVDVQEVKPKQPSTKSARLDQDGLNPTLYATGVSPKPSLYTYGKNFASESDSVLFGKPKLLLSPDSLPACHRQDVFAVPTASLSSESYTMMAGTQQDAVSAPAEEEWNMGDDETEISPHEDEIVKEMAVDFAPDIPEDGDELSICPVCEIYFGGMLPLVSHIRTYVYYSEI